MYLMIIFDPFGKEGDRLLRPNRLDPSYAVIYGEEDTLDILPIWMKFKAMLEGIEPGCWSLSG